MTPEEIDKKLAELEKFLSRIAELKAQREEKPKPPHPRPYPKDDQNYFYVNSTGEANETNWLSDLSDLRARKIGNVFVTESAAVFAAERLKVLAEMNEWAGKSNDGAYIYYHRSSDDIIIDWDGNGYYHGDVRFRSTEDAENCVKAVGIDRIKKYYFMIPEDEEQ